MLDIKGGLYLWPENILISFAKRLLSGDELTINYINKSACINKYVSANSEEVPFDYAILLVQLGFMDADSGNTETGEIHYKILSV